MPEKNLILFISHDSNLHGATRSMIDIADLIRDCQTESLVVFPYPGGIENKLKERSIPYKEIYYSQLVSSTKVGFLTRLYKLGASILRLPKIIKEVKKINPKIIYVNSSVNYWMIVLGLFIKKPLVFHLREFGKADHNYEMDFNGILFKFLKRIPKVVIANSNAIKTYFRQHYNIESVLVYNGVLSKKQFDLNKKKGCAYHNDNGHRHEIVNFGVVGNIIPGKGQLDVVKALHKIIENFSSVHLFLIGSGDTDPIYNYINTYNLQSFVTITGFIDDVSEYYKLLDILIVNSAMEAFGRVTIEGASYGIPVIGRNSGGTSEILTNMETGILHDGTIDDLAEKIMLLVKNKDLRKNIGEEGWRSARLRFSLEEHIERLREIFGDCIRANN